jgi:ferredoxin, 2Fe-2S
LVQNKDQSASEMPKIRIENLFDKILQADTQKTLLQNFQEHQLDWMHACGGKGRCTTCRVLVKQGTENFEPLTAAEIRYRSQGSLQNSERLSCQAKIVDDVIIVVPDDCKLPHIHYSA